MVARDGHFQAVYRFVGGALTAVENGTVESGAVENGAVDDMRVLVADSWLVDDGRTLALQLHFSRFSTSVMALASTSAVDLDGFLDAVVDRIPVEGAWFPRIELFEHRGRRELVYLERTAPERHRSVRLATLQSPDPRRYPTVKGPDLERLSAARLSVRPLGADEAVILSPDGFVVEGAYSSLMWWRGDTLCLPDLDLARIDSVTSRSVVALATARGTDVAYESVAPAALDGLEVWAASALHGIRIALTWIDGPLLAEHPGRLLAWRAALDKLTRPIATLSA